MTLTIDTEWPSHTVPLNTGLTVDCFSSVERDLSRWGITSHFFKHFFHVYYCHEFAITFVTL